MVRALAPTDDANELATSLAPMPKAQMKEKMHDSAKIQVYALGTGEGGGGGRWEGG